MNTITIEMSKEDRKILEDLLGSVTLLASVLGNQLPKETQTAIIAEATEDCVIQGEEAPAATVETPAPAPAAVPIIIVFLAFQKYFTQGITMGAVKG